MIKRTLIIAFLFFTNFISSDASEIKITSNLKSVPMGQSVIIEAQLSLDSNIAHEKYLLLPFVNKRRWGAHEKPDASGKAIFFLPFPNPGLAQVEVIAIPMDDNKWPWLKNKELLLAGSQIVNEGIHSNVIGINVEWRKMPQLKKSKIITGMQWEPWFIGNTSSWQTAQAVPLVGYYNSFNRDVIRQHVLWMIDAGIDFIMPDWSNHIWGCKHWNDRATSTNMILHATQLFLETLADMKSEGIEVPQVVLMPGLSNGPPAEMTALNEELEWIYQNYIKNPRFEGLWLKHEGKPLIVILDTGGLAHPDAKTEKTFQIPFFKITLNRSSESLDSIRANQIKVDDTHFTVRWMSSQNQTTGHDKLGYWTWMDGITESPITYNKGIAEAATVSTAFFNAYGWTAPDAQGRRGGSTLVETFNWAFKHEPLYILFHQFNEFRGQPEGDGYGEEHNIYVDSYSVELSDDIEPVSLTSAGYRGDDGGWGFYFLNLTKALIAIAKGEAGGSTILTVSSPLWNSILSNSTKLKIEWAVAGRQPKDYTIEIDGKVLKENIKNNSAEISLTNLNKGKHVLTLKAEDGVTNYPLSYNVLDIPLSNPMPAVVNVPFEIR